MFHVRPIKILRLISLDKIFVIVVAFVSLFDKRILINHMKSIKLIIIILLINKEIK